MQLGYDAINPKFVEFPARIMDGISDFTITLWFKLDRNSANNIGIFSIASATYSDEFNIWKN